MLTSHFDEFKLESIRNENDIVFSGPFLDLLIVFGEQVDFVNGQSVNFEILGLVDMSYSSNDADFDLSFDLMVEHHGGVEFLLLV